VNIDAIALTTSEDGKMTRKREKTSGKTTRKGGRVESQFWRIMEKQGGKTIARGKR